VTAATIHPPIPIWRAYLSRIAVMLAIWIVVAGHAPGVLVVGVLAAITAGAVSLKYLPPGTLRPRFFPVLVLLARFPCQALVAGCDVAWRALSPRMPLHLGTIRFQPRTRERSGQQAFLTLMSLFPGTLPTGTVTSQADDSQAQFIHCLDVSQPVAIQMAREENSFRAAFGMDEAHD